MIRVFGILAACLLLSACGGGGGSSSTSTSSGTGTTSSGGGTVVTPPPPAPTLTNLVTLVVDQGPSALRSGSNNFYAYNQAYVSVTLCAPGSTTNCQTIDHVAVDTGSVGLRIVGGVLNPSLLSALPIQTDASANPVGECYGYVDGYVFGAVRAADFQIGGEQVAGMPLQVIGDTGISSTVPASCSSGGGSQISTVVDLSANGIIGIGVTSTDCGANCTVAGGYGAATYYDCPSSGCSTIITRANATTAPFQQLPNPVAAMSVDNNGTIISLPSLPSTGSSSATGTLYFGIGTQTNNALGGATVLTTTTSTSGSQGPGFVTALYKNQTLNQSYIDSGTNLYLFTDSTITACTDKGNTGYYCPASPLSLTPQIQGSNGATASAAFVLNNTDTQFATGFSAIPGIGGDSDLFKGVMDYPRSFAFGLPFFYGRTVFTAIEGRNAGGTMGPYFAY